MGSAFMDDMVLDCFAMTSKIMKDVEETVNVNFDNTDFDQIEEKNPGLTTEMLSILES